MTMTNETAKSVKLRVYIPILKTQPDGTITAGFGVRTLLDVDCNNESALDGVLRSLNELKWSIWIKWMIRWLIIQFEAQRSGDVVKIFTSYHAPFFASGHLVVIHDIIPFRFPLRYPAQTFYVRNFLGTVLSSSDGVVVISQTVKDGLVALFPLIRNKVTVIPSFSTRASVSITANGLSPVVRERTKFLMVGLTRRHKNLDWGVASVEAAASAVSGISLDAVGVWKEFWPDVIALVESPGWKSRVCLHGYLDDTELDRMYRRSTALLYLSCDEGMGLPPLEAMARDCPVICSDIPIFREVCGEAAFYVPLGDVVALSSLLKMLACGELESQVQRKSILGRERVAHYGSDRLRASWRVLISRYSQWRSSEVI